MKRSRVPTEPELPVGAAPPDNYANERGKAVAASAADEYPPWMGDFLKNCFYCKRAIRCGENIYMYRDFCAFCSEDCRETQMKIDEEKLEEELKRKGKGKGKARSSK